MDTIQDRLWIWGHPENSLLGCFGIDKESHVTPVNGMKELGAKNLFYVPMNKETDRDAMSYEMQRECLSFGWSIENREQAQALPELKKKYPNLSCGVFDDFFCPENAVNNMTAYTTDELRRIKTMLNDAGMELWAVYYERQIDLDLTPYLDCFDGFTFWFWRQPTEEEHERVIDRFISKTPGKRRRIGCYLYDFGRETPCKPENIPKELDRDAALMRRGLCEGIILHTNAVGGMGLAAYDEAIKWVQKHGNEPV